MDNNLLSDIRREYSLDVKKITNIEAGWINHKYIIEADEKKYVLKELSMEKFPKNYYDHLCNTIKIQNDLYNMGIPTPKIYLNNNLKIISKFYDNKSYFLQDYIELNTDDVKLNGKNIYDIGRNLSLLHKCLRRYNYKDYNNDFLKYKDIFTLKKEFDNRIQQLNHNSIDTYRNELLLHRKIIEDIEQNEFLDRQELQLIHGDFTPDNIIYDEEHVLAILDFELVRVNTRLQDIGRIILSTCFDEGILDESSLLSFIKGYNLNLPLKSKDIADSLKIVWINEVDIWIKERYFANYNPPKVNKFINEIRWLSENWFDLDQVVEEVLKHGNKKSALQHKFSNKD